MSADTDVCDLIDASNNQDTFYVVVEHTYFNDKHGTRLLMGNRGTSPKLYLSRGRAQTAVDNIKRYNSFRKFSVVPVRLTYSD